MVEIDDLTAEQRALLDAIVRGGPDPRRAFAWTEAVYLWETGHEPGTFDELVGAGLVVAWDLSGLLRYTLTPYGAWLMGVHILERTTIVGEELSEDPYWAEVTKEPPPLHLPKRRHEIRWPWMDEVPDPNADDPVHGPEHLEYLVDEVSGKEVELFTQLFDGTRVQGIKIRIDPKLKGPKGKAKKSAKPRRKAG
jgi:hypothetical protein